MSDLDLDDLEHRLGWYRDRCEGWTYAEGRALLVEVRRLRAEKPVETLATDRVTITGVNGPSHTITTNKPVRLERTPNGNLRICDESLLALLNGEIAEAKPAPARADAGGPVTATEIAMAEREPPI